jgi:hypothetical protein
MVVAAAAAKTAVAAVTGAVVMGSGEDESMSGEKREGCEMRKE